MGCEESLRRLGRERLDLLQFHDIDRSVPIEESWGALQELVAEGDVWHGGLSNHGPDLVERALAVGPVAALQFQYSAVAREHEERLLPYAPLEFVLAHPAVTGAIVGVRNEREAATSPRSSSG